MESYGWRGILMSVLLLCAVFTVRSIREDRRRRREDDE